MSEEVIYADSNVSVSTSRIVIGATTYALRNITSGKMSFTPAKSGCAVLLITLGGLILLGGLASAGGPDSAGPVMAGLFSGSIIGGIGFLWMRACKTEYHVLIASSSGEAKAMTSKDRSYIENIVGSINDAIIRYR